ncbi:MAG: type II toxin-antitoxin system VapC family toxin [Deltaproteobacteria bacterium]|nr:type II toxin-antitoxin system VapC family toxin [Deltaproteobacteria bacterium]
MHYLDTNILVYAAVNQDQNKMQKSQALIRDLGETNNLLLSPLSLQEFIFTLSKLNVNKEHIRNNYSVFKSYCRHEIDLSMLDQAFETCRRIDFCKNINDIIHITFAEKFATAFSTFDHDFKKIKDVTPIDINIL